MRKIAADLEAPTDPDLAGSKSRPPVADFTNRGKAEVPETPRNKGRSAEAGAIHGLAVDGVLHRERIDQPDRSRCRVAIGSAQGTCRQRARRRPKRPRLRRPFPSPFDEARHRSSSRTTVPVFRRRRIHRYSIIRSGFQVREAYAQPNARAQGNALKTILAMGYVLDDSGDDACGKTIIEAHGIAHRISFAWTTLSRNRRSTHVTKPSTVTKGTQHHRDAAQIRCGDELHTRHH